MFKSFLGKSKIYLNLLEVARFFKRVDLKPIHLIGPAVLALFASVFEGFSIGLLIPTVKGIIEANFGFVWQVPLLKNVLEAFPSLFVNRNSAIFILLVGFIFSFAFAKSLFQYASSLGVQSQVRRFANNLRKLIYARYLSFGKLFFDRHNAGHLHQILTENTTRIALALKGLHDSLNMLFMLVVYLILMATISWKLTVLVVAVFPALPFSLRWLIHRIKKTSGSFIESYSGLSKKISNALSCIPLVKSYTNEENEKKWFAHESGQIEKLEFSIDRKELLIPPAQEIMTLFLFLVLVAGMAFLILKERSGEIAGFMVFLVVLRRSMATFGFLNQFQASLASVDGPIREVMEIFQDREKYFVPDGKRAFLGLRTRIEFDHLNFAYPKGLGVLKDVTFSIERGKMTAIVGPSGAGKTTLVSLVMRFYDCPPSSIKIDGVDIREFSLASLRERMAYVSQDTFLFNDTLRNNILYGLDGCISESKLIEAAKKARLYDLVQKLPHQFETLIGDRGVRLSGGERQRVSIARAIAKEVEILILDEATSALDTATEKLIQEAIEELIRHKTSIVIAHRLSTIKNADHLIVMEDGQMTECGALRELLEKKGAFYHYWEAQKFY